MYKTLLIFTILLLGIGCSSYNTDRKYIYLQPSLRITDAYAGKLVNEYDSVFYSNMQIEVNMPYQTFTASAKNIWPSNELYASHKEGKMIPMENIVSIQVIPLYNYNTLFPKGSDMSDSCVFKENNISYSNKSLINRLNAKMSNYYTALSEMKIIFKTAPSTKQTQQFALVLKTDRASSFSDTTVVITLKP